MHALLKFLAGGLEYEELVAAPACKLLVLLDLFGHFCSDFVGCQRKLVHEVAIVANNAVQFQQEGGFCECHFQLFEALDTKQESAQIGVLQVAIAYFKDFLPGKANCLWPVKHSAKVNEFDDISLLQFCVFDGEHTFPIVLFDSANFHDTGGKIATVDVMRFGQCLVKFVDLFYRVLTTRQ